MSTTYGTISTEPPPPELQFLSRVRQQIGTRRPWKEMVSSISLPESFSAALERIHMNAAYFHVNYSIIILFTLFISLLWHPIALIVFIVTMAAWLFLYFLRDDPVVVFGYGVQARVILVVLSIFTVALLLLTHAMVFVVGLTIGVVVVVIHGAFRGTSDHLGFGDEEGAGGDGGGSHKDEKVVDMKETASASYSNS